jgi:hypothetical protein
MEMQSKYYAFCGIWKMSDLGKLLSRIKCCVAFWHPKKDMSFYDPLLEPNK